MDEPMHHRKDSNEGLYAVAIAMIVSVIILSGVVVYAANSINSNLGSINSNLGNIKINVNSGIGTGQQLEGTPTPTITATPTPAAGKPTNAELAGNSPFLGPSDAKVVIVEFTDYQCPYCGAAAGTHEYLISQFKGQDPTWEASEPKLKELAKANKIKLVVRNFPLTNIHPFAQKASEAAECARDQNKFWEMHDVLFNNQDALTIDNLKKYAADLKLETTKFNDCLDKGTKAAVVNADQASGVSFGVTGTPAFFVNGQLISGAQSFTVFDGIIKGLGKKAVPLYLSLSGDSSLEILHTLCYRGKKKSGEDYAGNY